MSLTSMSPSFQNCYCVTSGGEKRRNSELGNTIQRGTVTSSCSYPVHFGVASRKDIRNVGFIEHGSHRSFLVIGGPKKLACAIFPLLESAYSVRGGWEVFERSISIN